LEQAAERDSWMARLSHEGNLHPHLNVDEDLMDSDSDDLNDDNDDNKKGEQSPVNPTFTKDVWPDQSRKSVKSLLAKAGNLKPWHLPPKNRSPSQGLHPNSFDSSPETEIKRKNESGRR
jgi:hypothetical protein